MEDRDLFKDIFSEKLKNMELPVDQKLWTSISGKVGTTVATGTTTGATLFTKIVIGTSIVAASITGGYFLLDEPEQISKKETADLKEKKQEELPKNTSISQSVIENSVNQNQITISQQEKRKENTFTLEKVLPEQVVVDKTVVYTPVATEINRKTITKDEPKPVSVSPTDNVIKNNAKVQDPVKTDVQKTPQRDELTSNSKTEEYEIKLNNIFSPNNDGANDLFFIESKGLEDFSIVIMDKNSKPVYSSNDPDFKWDGFDMQGNLVDTGTYVYYVIARTKSGQAVKKYQTLTIER